MSKQPASDPLDLRYRIIDKGFTIRTMPSVKRPPTSTSTLNPLSAKIHSNKSKLAPVYQSQSSILHMIQGSYLGSPEKIQGSYLAPQAPLSKEGFRIISKDEGGKKKQEEGGGWQEAGRKDEGGRKEEGAGRFLSRERKTYSSQFNLNAKSKKGDDLYEGDGKEIEVIVNKNPAGSQFLLNPSLGGGTISSNFFKKELLLSNGFNNQEMGRSKYIVDKMAGKFRIDKRYLNSQKGGRSATPGLAPGTPALLGSAPLEDEEGVKPKKNMLTTYKRPASRIDKYIDLILKNVTNLDEFIYLVKVNDDDPYYLDVIDYEKIKKSKRTEYYTISKKGLCHYDNGKPLEFIQLANWLKERETYDQIKSLTFFTKFRKWKTLKMWKKNVIGHKTSNYQHILSEKLFILNPDLRPILLNHRKHCTEMEKLRFIDLNQQQYGLSAEIPKLDEFKTMQEKKRKAVNEKIQEFSKKSRENIREGFKISLDTLRKNNYSAAFEDDFGKRNENQNLFRLKESAYENLGFPDSMNYERRSELRRACSKFLRFSYLVDFLSMEALKNIYVFSVEDLIHEFDVLVQTKDSVIYKDKSQKGSSKIREPLFFLNVDFNFKPIPEDEITLDAIKEFIPPPIGTSKPEDFLINYHVFVSKNQNQSSSASQGVVQTSSSVAVAGAAAAIPPAGEEAEEDPEENYDENKLYLRKVCTGLSRLWLNLRPNLDAFYSDIVRCLGEGMNAIQAFERWSRHDEMTPYVSVLEEWDDMVGDDWEMPDSNYLDPQEWLVDHSHSPLERYSQEIKTLLTAAFQRVETFLESFNRFLTIFWENSMVDLEVFKSEHLIRQSESIQNTLTVLNAQKEILESQLPYQADLGLLRVDSSELRNELLPSPENLIKQLQSFLPEILKARTKNIKEWLTQSSYALKSGTGNLDEFVRQRNALRIIEREYPKMKKKLDTLNLVYIQLKEFHFEIKDDQFIETIHAANVLANAINNANESIDKGLETNAMKITKQLIPDLEKALNDIDYRVKDIKYLSRDIQEDDAIKELGDLQEEFKKLEQLGNKYRDYQKILGLDETDFEAMRNLKEDLELRYLMWKSLTEWRSLTKSWIDGKFNEIDTEQIISKGEYFTNIIRKSQKKLPPNPILDELKEIVFDFKDTMPVVIALRNKNLKDHHWKDIKTFIGQNFEIDDDFTLQKLMAMNVVRCMKEIQEISIQATQESILEKQFDEINTEWLALEFIVSPYKSDKAKELFVLIEMDDLFAKIDEFLANLNNILGSRYLKMLRPKAEELQKRLLYTQETIDDWLVCQKNWIYLENIFDAPDIKKKLQTESTQFDNVDKIFRQQMRKTNQLRNVIKCVPLDIGKTFKKSKETLNNIQKALENYLELKRANFPRFYFLSNDELLEILAKAQDLQAIQKHMKKCFDNIYKLDLGEDPKSTSVYAMISGEGEKVEFNKPITTRGIELENWLNNVQEQMRDTIAKKMKTGKNDNDTAERKKWVLDHPGQVIATISQIVWCSTTEYFLEQMSESPGAMTEWYTINATQLSQLTELVRSSLDDVKHRIIVALITQDVHARDIIEILVNENVSSKTDFLWQQQLRYYWEEEIVSVNQVNAKIKYGYEYMGATSRLVITPLTDRCWITITGALNIKLGASPSGPAGTGKTESTKDLAKALGMLCVVFNCSDQIEYRMMARLFSGLAQQGAWSCLDEFNRIDIEVLSVIAQQLLTIRTANLKNEKKFLFGTDFIHLREGFGVFITMNPGYAGRTELPDNLKVLFRPVAMMIPDYRLIAEIILFSEGFEDSKTLSNKMSQLYKLSSEQLSQQKHYDFGMRAVKSVLVMAGGLKRMDPNSNENGVLIKAMRDSNIPKFLKDDIPLFEALIRDLFPDVQIPVDDYTVLSTTVEKICLQSGLQNVPKLTTKVIQLFETFNVRFGVMLVGETGSAKTTCYQVLQNAMSELRKSESADKRYQVVHTYVLNPKCISMGELYGEVNKFTDEWQDGLASKIMREAATDEVPDRRNDKHWVVFDGPVDALWIENMNTVLDDNMMLCLANGQRIKLRSEMRMLFEVNDLTVASPATVSRCGMVYLTFEELGWRPYVQSWCERLYQKFRKEEAAEEDQTDGQPASEYLNKELKVYLSQLFEDTMEDALKFIRGGHLIEPIGTVDIQLVTSLTNLLECFLNKDFGFRSAEKIENKKRYINHIFAFSCIWSIGSTVSEELHYKVDDFFRKKFANILFPNTDNVFGFYLDNVSGDFAFKSWNEMIKEFVYEKETPYFNLLVPTIDTVRYSFLIEWLLALNKKVFLTGYSGTGKSVVIKTLLRALQEPRSLDAIFLMFSAATDSAIIQQTIESKLEKYKKTVFGAKPKRKMVIFIDDINMPAVEKYGAQPPIELLRLMIDKGGVYDRREHYWKELQNITFLGVAAPPTGGRNPLTKRFTRHFNMFCLPQPSQKILFKIFNSILNGFFTSFNFVEAVKRNSESVTLATIDVYTRIVKEKKAIPSKSHYTFNLRDVSKVFQGILMTKPSAIKEQDPLARLWIHEVSRVFSDRLINDEDRNWFYALVIELLARHFNTRWEIEEIFIKNKILFGDLLKLDAPTQDYEEIKDLNKLLIVLDDKQDEYNSNPKKKGNLSLVFFSAAVEHVLRIARVLRQPRGNLMLIGVGGSGKQSLTKLSAYLLNHEVRQVEIVKGFDQEKFREFLRKLLEETGVDRNAITFLFTDTQIVDESFLEDINNLLNSGEVPNIWEQPEDKERVINNVRAYHVGTLKKPDAPDLIYGTFVEQVRDNLHIVLCMSPVGDALRIRIRKFPSLVDCCTLDWFASWPEEALLSVSTKLLSDFALPSDDIRRSLAEMCKEVHLSAGEAGEKFYQQLRRRVYTTPKSFLDMLNLYMRTVDEKREEISNSSKRLSNGLSKLHSVNELVGKLKIYLKELQPQLEEQSKQVDQALVALEKDSRVARDKEILVERDREDLNNQAHEIKRIADDAQQDLDIVKPELDLAEKAILEIDRPALVQMRSYVAPPQVVEDVLKGLCILFGKKYDWATGKNMMQDLNAFINGLINFPKDTLKEEVLLKFRKHRFDPKVCFKPEEIKARVGPAADLCTWCIAMDTYASVGPKKAKVAQLQTTLDEANRVLGEKEEELKKVKEQVAILKKNSDEMVNKKNETEKMINQSMRRLSNAEALTSLLKEEGERWTESIKAFEAQIETIFGDVFLSTAAISYCGPFTGLYRAELNQKWLALMAEKNILISNEHVNVVKTLGNPVVLRDWMLQGLPSDMVSQENALFATKGYKWPLMIDPQLQAIKWVRKSNEELQIKVMKFSDTAFQINMRSALTLGYPVLIQDVEETLDPLMDSLFAKQFFKTKDGRILLRFAEQDLDYHQDFRLFLTTKKPNPNYLPEIFIKVNVINFTVTFEGLEEQLLAEVVKKEQPTIEQQRDENIVNLASFRRKILENETNILRLLAEAKQDTLLDDVNLIETLQNSKKTSADITLQIKGSIILEKKIEVVREGYKNVSIRGAILYFVIKDLAMIDPMYQYSLQYVGRLFNGAIESTPKDDVPSNSEEERHIKRIKALMDNITKVIFTNVCRGLFEQHTLLFSFLIVTSIQKQAQHLSEGLWSVFLRGSGHFDRSHQPPSPPVNELPLPPLSWDLFYFLDCSFPQFAGLCSDLSSKPGYWKEFRASLDFANVDENFVKIAGKWNDLNEFEKMLLVKGLRPERVLFAVSAYVKKLMGKFYLESPEVNMSAVHADSDSKTPIIFVLSQGADPTEGVMNFAKERGVEENLKIISLGQGQGPTAARMIEDGRKEGTWIFLQNCHLAKTWMPALEIIVEDLNTLKEEEIHSEFRLFLTSMPADYFPVSILQNGIKLTTEPPRGIKANMRRAFNDMTQEFLDSCASKPVVFNKLLWGLSFFHSLILERRKFGPLGWNIKYEFNDSDLATSKTVLQMLLNEGEESGKRGENVPWDALLFVTGHINYGGRVTDDWDRRLLLSILRKFYVPEVLAEEKYQFSESESYLIPGLAQIEDYREMIEALPIVDDPEVFGLHENANINYQAQESEKIVQTILSIQPKIGSSAGGKSSDEIILDLTKEILDSIPEDLSKESGNKELFVENEQGLIPSLSTVLLQEIDRFNTLLSKMRSTLQLLTKAIQGFALMSQELDSMYYSLLNNQVPKNWEDVSYLSLKPLASWLRDMKERVAFMYAWLTHGSPNAYWISGFFFPQGFLTGVLQTHARKYKIPIDQLSFAFKIMDDRENVGGRPTDGVYVYGFYLEGASLERKKRILVDQIPGEMYFKMPVIHFNPLENVEPKTTDYSCPVYKTSLRHGVLSTTGQSTNFILPVELPTNDENTDYWVLRGTAMLTQLNI